MRLKSGLFYFCFLWCLAITCKEPQNGDFRKWQVDTHPSPLPLSPQESMKKIQLPPGFRVEFVASEPLIKDPVAMAWDGNGRLYVIQMNSFMMDARGNDQYKPISQIVRLEDVDWDGVMDRSTVFIDSLVLPRVILPIGDELIVGITNIQHLYAYKDTDQDGKADQKRLVFENPANLYPYTHFLHIVFHCGWPPCPV